MKHTIWKAAGIVALLYVFAMAAFVRLGPGLLEIQVNETAQEATVTAFASHFSETADDLHVFVASGKQRHELPVLRVSDPTHVVVRWTLPDTLPTRSLNLFTNDPIDGTLLLENAAFVGESSVQVIDKAVNWPSISITEHPANLGFHFPYQPRIVESIRNLFLHVPLWFTMFLLAGIAFVGSVRQLGETGPSIHDERAEAATRVAVWFGVLGLITGSIWARGAWGAWWIDDPQLNGALVTVLVYSGYLVLRGSIDSPALRAKLSAVFNLFAFVILVILLLILPKFSESLHPGKDGSPAFNTYDLNNALRAVFYPAVIGWMLLSLWMYRITLRMQRLTHRTPEA